MNTSHFSLITLHDVTALLFSEQKHSSAETTLITTKSEARLKFSLYLQGNKLPTAGNPVYQEHGHLLFPEEAMGRNPEQTQPKFSSKTVRLWEQTFLSYWYNNLNLKHEKDMSYRKGNSPTATTTERVQYAERHPCFPEDNDGWKIREAKLPNIVLSYCKVKAQWLYSRNCCMNIDYLRISSCSINID